MTAPTHDGHDDDLRYPANQANPFVDDASETVPVSELMKQVPQQRADDPDLAPLRIDVSIAIFIALWIGIAAAQITEVAPDSDLIVWPGAITCAMLLIRWTRKR